VTTRRGGVLGKLLVLVLVASLAGALAWTTLANHSASGQWSFHPLDPAWWSPPAPIPGAPHPLAEVVSDTRGLADKAGEALWGQGGLVERCEAWWRSQPPTTKPPAASPPAVPPATSTPSAPAAPSTSVRDLLEQRLATSERLFGEGVELAKRARPSPGDGGGDLAGRLGLLAQARDRFAEVDRDLAEVIPAYQALPNHDRGKAATARQLQAFTRQMQELTAISR
jgi:hypothetical protein